MAEVLAGRLDGTIGSTWPFFDKELRLRCKFANDAQPVLCADGKGCTALEVLALRNLSTLSCIVGVL